MKHGLYLFIVAAKLYSKISKL